QCFLNNSHNHSSTIKKLTDDCTIEKFVYGIISFKRIFAVHFGSIQHFLRFSSTFIVSFGTPENKEQQKPLLASNIQSMNFSIKSTLMDKQKNPTHTWKWNERLTHINDNNFTSTCLETYTLITDNVSAIIRCAISNYLHFRDVFVMGRHLPCRVIERNRGSFIDINPTLRQAEMLFENSRAER
ncbi:MAG: hypothetical protein ACU84J_07950, partial [Gammaproteobacteria bacterium]